jgi:hypothetical protein
VLELLNKKRALKCVIVDNKINLMKIKTMIAMKIAVETDKDMMKINKIKTITKTIIRTIMMTMMMTNQFNNLLKKEVNH